MKKLLLTLFLLIASLNLISAQSTATAKTKRTTAKRTTTTAKNKTSSSQTIPNTFTVNGVTFKMIAVKGGTFTMGATSEQLSDACKDEKPTHSVTLSDFSIGETEVTQALWEAVMGSNPSDSKGSDKPVETVSWDDCQKFVQKLNSLTGQNFHLPTEAEWEYAARGGNKSRGYKYSGSNTLSDVAWCDGSEGAKSVKTKKPNELGIYDMSGNVWEWCSDWYGNYSSSSQTNPTGPSSGQGRVNRGGSWYYQAEFCRVSNRNSSNPGYRSVRLGLRLAMSELVNSSSTNSASTAATPNKTNSSKKSDSGVIHKGYYTFSGYYFVDSTPYTQSSGTPVYMTLYKDYMTIKYSGGTIEKFQRIDDNSGAYVYQKDPNNKNSIRYIFKSDFSLLTKYTMTANAGMFTISSTITSHYDKGKTQNNNLSTPAPNNNSYPQDNRKYQSETYYDTCPHCNGMKRCPTCLGRGYYYNQYSPNDVIPCPNCDCNHNGLCNRCHGTGTIAKTRTVYK